MSGLEFLALLLAIICGVAVGIEREFTGKSAGLKTNVLICLGAAIFTIISRHLGETTELSQTRIAAQIVTGVGFLGAGAIIQDRGGIHGLTTAATIWLMASVGMACGAMLFTIAIVSTIMTLLVLVGLPLLKRSISNVFNRNKKEEKDQNLHSSLD